MWAMHAWNKSGCGDGCDRFEISCGAQVEVTHLGQRKYKVKGLSNQGAGKLFFHNSTTDSEMSVAEYFHNQYNMQ